MIYWTLKTGSTEKSLADWGLENPRRELLSHAPSIVKLKLKVAGADVADAFAADATATIYRNRTSSGGSTPTYSGGTIWFFGKFTDTIQSEEVPNAAHEYELRDPWYWLERITFVQQWICGDGLGGTGGQWLSKLILFVDILGAPMNVAQVVTEILTYAISAGAPLQIGTIDPALYSPSMAASSLTCAEALKRVLRCAPDCITYFDYTTTPPTLHVRQRSTLSAVNIALTDTTLTGLELTPLASAKVNGVIIEFDTISSIGGNDYYVPTFDIYPGGTTAATDGVLVANLDLKGVNGNIVRQPISTMAFDDTDVTSATDAADFWSSRAGWLDRLKNPPSGSPVNILSGSLNIHDVKFFVQNADGSETDVTSSTSRDQYPNEIKDGAVATWMARTHRRERITCLVDYTLYANPPGGNVDVQTNKPLSIILETTNAGNGDGTEKVYSSFEGSLGEAQPTGLAEYYYNALNTVYWRGQVTLTAGEVATTQLMGSLINLTGGTGKYAAINALVSRVTEDLEHGRTTIEVGPPAHLSPSELLDLLRVWRDRVPGDWYGRKTGLIKGRSNNLPTKTGPTRANAVSEEGVSSYYQVASVDGHTTLTLDATGKILTVKNDATGAATATIDLPNKKFSITDGTNAGSIDLVNGQINITDGTNTISAKIGDINGGGSAKFQETCLAVVTAGPDSNGCYTISPLHCWVLRSDAIGTCP